MSHTLKSASIIMVMGLILLSLNAGAFAASIEGNKCFTLRVTQSEDGPENQLVTLKLHTVKVDAATFIVSGTVSIPTDNPVTMTGIGTLAGGFYVLNMDISQIQKSGKRETGIAQIRIRALNLSGTFYANCRRFDPARKLFDDTYSAGTLAPRTCN